MWPWRCQYFPPGEDKVRNGAPLDLVVIFRLLCQLDWGRQALCLMVAGTLHLWSGTKVSSQSEHQQGRSFSGPRVGYLIETHCRIFGKHPLGCLTHFSPGGWQLPRACKALGFGSSCELPARLPEPSSPLYVESKKDKGEK